MGNTKEISKDCQRHSFQLTINNPLPEFPHEIIRNVFQTEFKTIRFYCMSDEIGANGTPHTHVYVCFASRVRWTTLKRHFPTAHIEIAHGSVLSNIEYIKKTGKWADTDKAETKVENSYEEWGTPPTQKGVRPEMEELFEMIKAGFSNTEILAHNNDYILNIDKLDRVRTMLLIDENKSKRRLDLRVIYICGATGSGKTRSILDEHGDFATYRVTDYAHPFDGYECQKVMVFEEFRSGFRLSDVLNYMDVYPIQLPARYSNKFACYDYLYIISNWKLEEQYSEVQRENPESWKAFLRRIHEVRVFHEDGSVEIYNSVQEYLDRNYKFCTIADTEKLPFEFD